MTDLERLETLVGTVVDVEAIVVMASESKSGKTRYLRFTQDWKESAHVMIRVSDLQEDVSFEFLKSLAGKKVKVSGVVEKEFGNNKTGIRVKAKDQITVVE